jgi:hypothetical protein
VGAFGGSLGTLIVDGRGCLRLRSAGEGSATPLWPPGFELSTGNGGMRVLDARGRLRAKVGEKVRLSGGYTKLFESHLQDRAYSPFRGAENPNPHTPRPGGRTPHIVAPYAENLPSTRFGE